MRYLEALAAAQKINGIVVKTRRNDFAPCKSLWSFAIAVCNHPQDASYYEVVSDKQCTYLDLDLKRKNCVDFPSEVKIDK